MSGKTSVTIPIGGMTCRNCVASVTKALAEQPKVVAVDVNLAAGEARVSGADLDVAGLREAIENLGFDAGEPT